MVWSCEEDARRETAQEGFRMDSTREKEEGKTCNQLDTGDYGNDEREGNR